MILPKRSGYVNAFKDKDEDKNKNNRLISLCIDDEKLSEKHKTIWTKIENLKYIILDALLVYDSRCKKVKIKPLGILKCAKR